MVVQGDHNSERFTFEIPRYTDGHDMSACNVVQVHYLNIDSTTREQNPGIYEIDDLQISPEGDDVVICSWLISGNATKYIGTLFFVVRFSCVSEDGTIDYVWNTAKHSNVYITEGIYNGEYIEEEYADILAQWEARIQALEQNSGSGGGGSAAEGAIPVEIDFSNFVNGSFTEKFGGGEVVLAASDPVVNDGKHYYNAMILPALPEWDKETYPYATIAIETEPYAAYLYLSEDPSVVSGNFSNIPGKMICYTCCFDQATASEMGVSEVNEWCNPYEIRGCNTHISCLLWANHDIRNGVVETVTHTVAFDENGNPVNIDGVVIKWGAEA
jgi:hypothetical protein